MMGFRENLKTELMYSGMLVKELAFKTGVKKHTLDNYLSNREMMPAADVAVLIAKALGVSVEYLVCGEESPTSRADASPFSAEARLLARNFDSLSLSNRAVVQSVVATLKKTETALS